MINAINQVLYNRKAGIKYVEYNNYKSENIHDINQIFESQKNNKNGKIKIFGKLQKLNDIQNLAVKKWPLNTLNHIKKGGHYVFFNSGIEESSFLTTNNFKTQLGREVVFHVEKKLNKKFLNDIKIQKANPHLQV